MSSDYVSIALPDYLCYPEDEMRERAKAFLAEVKRRHTVREFSNKPVPRDIIETCIEAAARAPNGANHQPWHFAIVSSAEIKTRIRLAAEAEEKEFYAGKAGEDWLRALKPLGTDPEKPFLETAPWLICVFGERKSRSADGVVRKNYYVSESDSIAIGFLILALHHAGLATLTHTPAPMGFLNEICQRPYSDKPYILLVVGYPAKSATIPAHALDKKRLGDITSFF